MRTSLLPLRSSHASILSLLFASAALVACSSTSGSTPPTNEGANAAPAPTDGQSSDGSGATPTSSDGGTPKHDSGPPTPPPVACSQSDDCAPVTCACAGPSDVCGANAVTEQVKLCQSGVCATDPKAVCANACALGGQPNYAALPTASDFGGSWSTQLGPWFDTVIAFTGSSDDSFSLVTETTGTTTTSFETRVWSHEPSAWTDTTPDRVRVAEPDVRWERAVGLASFGGERLVATSGVDTMNTHFSKLLRPSAAAGEIPIAIDTIEGLLDAGSFFVVGGATASQPALATVDGSGASAITLPTSVASSFGSIAFLAGPANTGAVYAATKAHLVSVTSGVATEIALPANEAVRGLAYANGRLYALLAATMEIHATLWSWDGASWAADCSPERGVETIGALRDGALFASTRTASYVVTGQPETWRRLPTSELPSHAWGSQDTLYAFVDGVSGKGKILHWTP